MEKSREFQKNIYFCFIDYTKAFDCVDHNKLWKILKEMKVPDYLTCLLRNLHVGQEATEPNMEQLTGPRERSKTKLYVVTLFTYVQSTSCEILELVESRAGIKIARRNINKLRYADDTTLMAESEEKLKSLLMKVKEESEKAGLKLNIQKMKIMASGPIAS